MTLPAWGHHTDAESTALFRRQWEIGKAMEHVVADELRWRGLKVEEPPARFRDNAAEIAAFTKREADLVVEGCKVDVKSSRRAFDGPWNLPFHDTMIDTVSGWDAKAVKPCAVILVSQPKPHGFAVIPVSTRPHWKVIERHDTVRDLTTRSYAVDRARAVVLADFVRWVVERRNGRA